MFPWNTGDKVLLSHNDRVSKDVVTFISLNDDGTCVIKNNLQEMQTVSVDRLSPYQSVVTDRIINAVQNQYVKEKTALESFNSGPVPAWFRMADSVVIDGAIVKDRFGRLTDLDATVEKTEETISFSHRRELLEETIHTISRDRNASYGDPDQDFARTANLWSEYLGHEIKPHDVAVMMILLKVSRLSWNPDHKDSWLDIAGYAACGFETHELRKDMKDNGRI